MQDDALPTSQHLFDKCCNSTLVLESPLIAFSLVTITITTSLHFWFWGYLRSKVYTSNRRNLSELKKSIKRKVVQIPSVILHSASLSTVSRMQCVIVCEGGNDENWWFKKCFFFLFSLVLSLVFFESVLCRQHSSYIHHSNKIHRFSMRRWIFGENIWVLPFENFFHCNRNRESAIVLNHHDIEHRVHTFN